MITAKTRGCGVIMYHMIHDYTFVGRASHASKRLVLGNYSEFFDDSGRFGKLGMQAFQNVQNR